MVGVIILLVLMLWAIVVFVFGVLLYMYKGEWIELLNFCWNPNCWLMCWYFFLFLELLINGVGILFLFIFEEFWCEWKQKLCLAPKFGVFTFLVYKDLGLFWLISNKLSIFSSSISSSFSISGISSICCCSKIRWSISFFSLRF